METADSLNFTTISSLGERDISQVQQSDILSALAFDTRGRYLSVGDYGGRCIVFERKTVGKQTDYEYLMEFQAFDKQIDTLSSQKIPDTVTQILWLTQPTTNNLLTANARGVKLWKI